MSALELTLARWSRVGITASVGPAEGPGWRTLAELTADARDVADTVAAVYGTTTTVGGTFLLARAARAVAEPCLHTLLDGKGLPLVGPDDAALLLNDQGRFDGVNFRAPLVAKGTPRTLASALVDAFGGFVDALRSEIPVGRRGLWGLVSDAVGGAGVSLVRRHPDALSVADEVLDHLERLHRSTARPTWVLHDGEVELRRGSCCLAFHLEAHGYCETCPVGRYRRPPWSAGVPFRQ